MEIRFKAGEAVYKQLANHLKRQIEEGVYKPGDQIPPEHTLSRTYHISRVTVRKSIQILTEEGLLRKVQGKGTFVAMDNFIESPCARGSFTLSCIQNNVIPATHIVSCEKINADEVIGADINTDEIIRIERIRYANEIPVIYETDYIPYDKHGYLFDISLEDESLMDVMSNNGHVSFGAYDDIIDICPATENHAAWLKVRKGSPLLRIYQKMYDTDKKIVYINEQIINSERYKYISVHSK